MTDFAPQFTILCQLTIRAFYYAAAPRLNVPLQPSRFICRVCSSFIRTGLTGNEAKVISPSSRMGVVSGSDIIEILRLAFWCGVVDLVH
jgi:hypothetical protein